MSNTLVLSQPDNLSYPLTADQVESLDRMVRELYVAILKINTFVGVPGILPIANGGTGADLSTLSKGSLIVGTAADRLGLLSVGTTGQVLTVDPSETDGVKWSPASSGTDAFVPYFIAAADTYVVPEFKQAVFALNIDVEGILEVDGFLIEVT